MRERLFKLVGIVVLAGSFVAGWLLMSYQQFVDIPMNLAGGGTVVLQVNPGSSVTAVARDLQRRGLIAEGRYFVWMTRLRGKTGSIQAGEYPITAGMTPSQLLANMVAGKVYQYAITLLEGWSFRQMMTEIAGNPYLRHQLKGLTAEAIMARLGHEGEHPEGRFFPDTYHFPRGLSDVEFLQRAYRAMAQRLEQEWPMREAGLPLQSPYEALILASIVEKETGLPGERAQIAGVFIRRLHKGMRLQTDPTVIYGMGLEYDGNIRADDLKKDTPYNTYTRKGLPPTPIAMPSGEALHAVLHPAGGESLYFVSRGDGSHHFSASYEEHECAVKRYQLRSRDCSHPNFRAE
ncbi:MAG: endolytic transglycosylase MltG [Gammaproteobacteria bacterium]|nr:endolytic transglycosylase MltG [Gammaproteobacteria bacterium]